MTQQETFMSKKFCTMMECVFKYIGTIFISVKLTLPSVIHKKAVFLLYSLFNLMLQTRNTDFQEFRVKALCLHFHTRNLL